MDNRELKMQCKAVHQTLHTASRTPLHENIVRGFNKFVADHPHALQLEYEYDQTLLKALYLYLLHAIEYKFPLETFQALVMQTPHVLVAHVSNRITLLHWLCVYNPTALEIISFFVQQYPDAAKAMDFHKRTPLHFACQKEASVPVIQVLVDAYPQATQICNGDGDTPLHTACRGGTPLDAVRFLVGQKPYLCLHRNKFGNVPLDRARDTWSGIDADTDVVEFMTTATTAAAGGLMKRLCFRGPVPREIFERAASYRYRRPAEVSGVVLALSPSEISVLFCRDGNFRNEQT